MSTANLGRHWGACSNVIGPKANNLSMNGNVTESVAEGAVFGTTNSVIRNNFRQKTEEIQLKIGIKKKDGEIPSFLNFFRGGVKTSE